MTQKYAFPAINLEKIVGKQVSFLLHEKSTIETKYGETMMYQGFINEKPYTLWGCSLLNKIMCKVEEFDTICLMYQGKVAFGNGRHFHDWTIVKVPEKNRYDTLLEKMTILELEEEITAQIKSLSGLIDRETAISIIFKNNKK